VVATYEKPFSLDDKDDRPDMAVGRIPAQTAEQVADVVAKTLAYEQDPVAPEWSGRALFVADDKLSSIQEISMSVVLLALRICASSSRSSIHSKAIFSKLDELPSESPQELNP
jgi:hypothetical protein